MDIPTDGLWQRGYSRLGALLKSEEAEQIRSLYMAPEKFRSHIDMARYRFGRGEYQYFAYPLPERIDQIRHDLYAHLAPVAREWMSALSRDAQYPDDLDTFLESCHAAGQTRPTPLLLRYRESDFNCLHQDLYGDVVFPFQVVIGLSRPGDEYSGGELLLVEQQPRAIGRSRDSSGTRRGRGHHHPLSPGKGLARLLQNQHAPRRQPPDQRRALHVGHHFSRCEVILLDMLERIPRMSRRTTVQ